MYCLYNIVVSSAREKAFVERIVSRYYRGWASVSIDKKPLCYNIFLRSGYGESYLANPLEAIEYSGSRSLESLSPIELLRVIERGRARIRETVTWDRQGFYRLDDRGLGLQGFTVNPGYDTMLFYGDNVYKLLMELGLSSPPRNTVVVKKFSGVHDLYSSIHVKARLHIPDYGRVSIREYSVETIDNNIDLFIRENKVILEKHIAVSKKLLETLDQPDLVIVSFSGGKDSLVLLDLVLEHYGRDKVVPVYVDTGLEFPETIGYISTIEEYYGLEIERVYAGIDKAVKEHGLPSVEDRWCTRLKQDAFWRRVEELSRGYGLVYVFVGDRDAESRSRSRRPPVRRRGRYIEIAPLKQWGTIHIQTYILWKKLPQNPLYNYGFYRVGCYICPALRSWELYIMRNKLWRLLRDREFIGEFMSYKKVS